MEESHRKSWISVLLTLRCQRVQICKVKVQISTNTQWGLESFAPLGTHGSIKTLITDCQWEDDAARKTIGHPPLYSRVLKELSL